jgi:cytochrome c-type biogenesis protein CcmE
VAAVKSRARFIIAIALAVGLGGWLAWTSFGGALETYASPGELSADGTTYRLNGIVQPGIPQDAAGRAQSEGGLTFMLRDKGTPGKTVRVNYSGSVPDTFRAGREIVVTGKVENGTFEAERNSLVALCPSKFTDDPNQTLAPANPPPGHPSAPGKVMPGATGPA